jgi:hypothetical protein
MTMDSAPEEQSGTAKPSAGNAPPLLPGGGPPVIGEPPSTGAAPPLPTEATPNVPRGRRLLAVLLSLGLGLFLADAVISLLDNSFILGFNAPFLTIPHEIVSLLALVSAFVIYVLMGFTRAVPKRLFLPLALFIPAAGLATVPVLTYAYGHVQHLSWVISLCQVILALVILYRLQGGFRLRWPLVAHENLARGGFSWLNLSLFLVVNVFVLAPMVVAYLGICAALAVGHFSQGFLTVRPAGFDCSREKVRPSRRQDHRVGSHGAHR